MCFEIVDDHKKIITYDGDDIVHDVVNTPRFCVKGSKADDASVRVVYAERQDRPTGIMQPDLGHDSVLQDRGWNKQPLAFFVARTALWVDLPKLTLMRSISLVSDAKKQKAKAQCAFEMRDDLFTGKGGSYAYVCFDRFDATLRDLAPDEKVVVDVQLRKLEGADDKTCPPNYEASARATDYPKCNYGKCSPLVVYMCIHLRAPTLDDRPADFVKDVVIDTKKSDVLSRLSPSHNDGDEPFKNKPSVSTDQVAQLLDVR